jgi:hypothetical protein
MKNNFIIVAILFTLTNISFGQDSTVYVAKGRLHWSIKRYTCAELILRSDSTFHYKEMADDICMDIADGKYEFRSDTIYLIRKDEYPTIKYIHKGNRLISLKEYTLGKILKKENVP